MTLIEFPNWNATGPIFVNPRLVQFVHASFEHPLRQTDVGFGPEDRIVRVSCPVVEVVRRLREEVP